MRGAVSKAERAFEIHRAARSWRRAGIIDDRALASIESRWPDDRVRPRPVFRVLFFLFASFAIYASFGLLLAIGFDGKDSIGGLSIVYGGVLVLLTELQTGPLRRDRGGTEEATGFAAIVFLAVGLGWFCFEVLPVADRGALTLMLTGCAALCAAAAWRWGGSAPGAAAALFLFWALARFPHGRLFWILAVGLFLLPLLSGQRHHRLAPSQRRACGAALIVVLAAAYGAISIYSLDRGLVEIVGDRAPGFWRLLDWGIWGGADVVAAGQGTPAWTWLRLACALVTAAMPVVLIVAALRARRRLLIDPGVVFLALSIATLRAYVHLAPTWIVLSAAGVVTLALALAIRRWLDSGDGHERSGFTAEPLFESSARRSNIAVAATLAALSPAARVLPREEPGFEGKGGSAGGAGAGGEF